VIARPTGVAFQELHESRSIDAHRDPVGGARHAEVDVGTGKLDVCPTAR
jgi:hypothetical protein